MLTSLALRACRTITGFFFYKKLLGMALAVATASSILATAPPAGLSSQGMTFLALLCAAVSLWLFEVFDEYIVALMLLLGWLLFDVAPPDIALRGFSQGPWFFALGALGMGAAVARSGLLDRSCNWILARTPARSRTLGLVLAGLGVVLTPLLPRAIVRLSGTVPITDALLHRVGAKPESNESAILALSSFVGSTVLTFMFLTGGTYCLVGWSLLPEGVKADFNWLQWTLAALPAGMLTFGVVLAAIFVFFPLRGEVPRNSDVVSVATDARVSLAAGTVRNQWVTAVIVAVTVLAWITRPLHGVSESWIALGALIVFLTTGVLDRKSLKTDIDWGLLLFFGIAYSVASVVSYLHVDKWIMGLVVPYRELFSTPLVFLLAVLLVTYILRLFVLPTPAIILVMVALAPWSLELGIHPGVLLLTALMGVESWIVPYQQMSYLLAYNGNGTKPFSHRQARRIMVAKFVASIIAVWISVPYWSHLGFIEDAQKTAETQNAAWGSLGFIEQEPAGTMERSVAMNSVVHASEVKTGTSSDKDIASLKQVPDHVASIQKILTELGYHPGLVDGILGPRTIRAIQKHQRRMALGVHGNTSRTLAARSQQSAKNPVLPVIAK